MTDSRRRFFQVGPLSSVLAVCTVSLLLITPIASALATTSGRARAAPTRHGTVPGKHSSKPHITITEFRLPHAHTWPTDIVAGPDGNMWFTEADSPVNVNTIIGRITPAGRITEFRDTLPTQGYSGAAQGLAVGHDGNLWFGENDGFTHIGWITPAGKINYFHYDDPLLEYSYDFDIRELVWGSDGNLWFTTPSGIGRLTPSGARTHFHLPDNVTPGGITTGPDGNLWFTAPIATTAIVRDYIGRITPSGVVTLFRIPTFNSAPKDITVGAGRAMWFTEAGGIGRITTTGKISEFHDRIPKSVPQRIAVGKNGNLWFADLPTNSIGRMTSTGKVTEYKLPTPHAFAWGVAVARNGDIWFTEGQAGRIGLLHIR